MAELVFKVDTKQRKQWFTGVSFSHPAKLVLPLQLWLIDNYTRPGELILDPMAGSGTILVACSMGRHVIAVELESKFVDIMKGNWVKVQERGPMMGYQMGTAKIICGDARNLPDILVDKCIFSPPYAERHSYPDVERERHAVEKLKAKPNSKIGGIRIHEHCSENPDNIGNLPYGSIDKVITSPTYGNIDVGGDKERHIERMRRVPIETLGRESRRVLKKGLNLHTNLNIESYPSNPSNLGNMKYGDIDAVITSPPYEGSLQEANTYERTAAKVRQGKYKGVRPDVWISPTNIAAHGVASGYGGQGNIGNLKGDSYLAAMLQVYQNCFAVLKPGSLMVLVTKNFIRNQKEVRLDEDTINLCEQAGFTLRERHYRKLTSLSFWRTIYKQKFPDAPVLNKEDILVFGRGEILK